LSCSVPPITGDVAALVDGLGELNEGWRAVYREQIDLSALVARKSHQPAISPES
jgi:hypothetical protein